MFGAIFGEQAGSDQKEENDTKEQEEGLDIGNVFNSFLSKTAKIAQTVTEAVNENVVKGLTADFQNEQRKFINSKRKHDGREAAVPPWVGHENEDELKIKILALSSDKRNFTRDPPAGQKLLVFDFEEAHPIAMAILQDDKDLEKMRFDLVPKTCSEERFWRNYFYRVSLIKQSSEVSSMGKQAEDAFDHVSMAEVQEQGENENHSQNNSNNNDPSDVKKPDDTTPDHEQEQDVEEEFADDPLLATNTEAQEQELEIDLAALDGNIKTTQQGTQESTPMPADGHDENAPTTNMNSQETEAPAKGQKHTDDSEPPSPQKSNPPLTSSTPPMSSDTDWEKELADELDGFEMNEEEGGSSSWEEVAQELESELGSS